MAYLDQDPQNSRVVPEVTTKEFDPLSHLSTSLNARVRALRGDAKYFNPTQALPSTVDVGTLPFSPSLVYHVIQSEWNKKRREVTDTPQGWGKRAAKATLSLFEQHQQDAMSLFLLKSAFGAWGIDVVTEAQESYRGQLRNVATAFEKQFFNTYGGEKPDSSIQKLGEDLVMGIVHAHGFSLDTLQQITREDAQKIAKGIKHVEGLLERWLGNYFQDTDNLNRFTLCVDTSAMSLLRRAYDKPVEVDRLRSEEVYLFESIAPMFEVPTTPLVVATPAASESSAQSSTLPVVRADKGYPLDVDGFVDNLFLSSPDAHTELRLTLQVEDYLKFRQRFFGLMNEIRGDKRDGWVRKTQGEKEQEVIGRLGVKTVSPWVQRSLQSSLLMTEEKKNDEYEKAIRLLFANRNSQMKSEADFERLEADALAQTKGRFLEDLKRVGISYKDIVGDVFSHELAKPLDTHMVRYIAERMQLIVAQLAEERYPFPEPINPSRVAQFLKNDISLADQIFHLYKLLPLEQVAKIFTDKEDLEREKAMQQQSIEEYMAIRSDIFTLMQEFSPLDDSKGKTDQFVQHCTQLASSLEVNRDLLVDTVKNLRGASREERITMLDTFLEYTNFPYRPHVLEVPPAGYSGNFISSAHMEIRKQWGKMAQHFGIFETYGMQDLSIVHMDFKQVREITAYVLGKDFFRQEGHIQMLARIEQLPTTEDQLYALMHILPREASTQNISLRRGSGAQENESDKEWDSIGEMIPLPVSDSWLR